MEVWTGTTIAGIVAAEGVFHFENSVFYVKKFSAQNVSLTLAGSRFVSHFLSFALSHFFVFSQEARCLGHPSRTLSVLCASIPSFSRTLVTSSFFSFSLTFSHSLPPTLFIFCFFFPIFLHSPAPAEELIGMKEDEFLVKGKTKSHHFKCSSASAAGEWTRKLTYAIHCVRSAWVRALSLARSLDNFSFFLSIHLSPLSLFSGNRKESRKGSHRSCDVKKYFNTSSFRSAFTPPLSLSLLFSSLSPPSILPLPPSPSLSLSLSPT